MRLIDSFIHFLKGGFLMHYKAANGIVYDSKNSCRRNLFVTVSKGKDFSDEKILNEIVKQSGLDEKNIARAATHFKSHPDKLKGVDSSYGVVNLINKTQTEKKSTGKSGNAKAGEAAKSAPAKKTPKTVTKKSAAKKKR